MTSEQLRTIITSESIQPRREWLISKISVLQQSYNDVLTSFRQRLDAIVNPVIDETHKLLSTSNEVGFFSKHYEVGINIEKSCHDLFEIKLVCCSEARPVFVSGNEIDFRIYDKNTKSCSSINAIEQNYQIDSSTQTPTYIKHQTDSGVLASHHGNEIETNPLCETVETASASFPRSNPTCPSFRQNPTKIQSTSSQTDSPLFRSVGIQLNAEDFRRHKGSNKLCQTDRAPIATRCANKICQTDIAYFNCILQCNSNSNTESAAEDEESISNEKEVTIKNTPIDNDDNGGTHAKILSFFNCKQTNQAFSKENFTDLPPSFPDHSVKSSQVSVEVDSLSTEVPPKESHEIFSQVLRNTSEATETFNDEIDLLLLHEITRGETISVIVTDAISPSHFTVQPKNISEQLEEMQRQINDFYASKDSPNLWFRDFPDIGTVCAARFDVDNLWYRAKITTGPSADKVQIIFIDYGNYSSVQLRSLRLLFNPMLAEVPPFSIPCSLSGVEAPGAGTWPTASVEWFQAQVCDRVCDAIFSEQKRPSVHPVQLFCSIAGTQPSYGNKTNIGEAMVARGYAVNEYLQTSSEIDDEKSTGHDVDKIGEATNEDLARKSKETSEVFMDQVEPLRTASGHALQTNNPDLWNDNHDLDDTRLWLVGDEYIETDEAFCSQTADTESTNRGLEQAETQLSKWNPMKDDHESERNKYDIDVDDACVAIENLDPRKAEVCKYFAKGDCWKGNLCERSHVSDPDVLYQAQVFSGHVIQPMELEAGEIVVVKVTTDPRDDDFYAHIIRRNRELERGDGQNSEYNLEQLGEDMKTYYTRVSTRQSIGNPVGVGEVYVLPHSSAYCRVSVLDVPSSSRIQVHLIDYGFVEFVSPGQLRPMQEAFMHLPAQAVLCTCDRSSKMSPEKNCCYFAKVGETMSVVDSPTPLTFLSKF